MILGKVVGTVVATKKDDRLIGYKLLIVEPIDNQGETCGSSVVAADSIGAGINEVVLLTTGSSARSAVQNMESPVDAAVVGIVDTMEVGR